MSPISIFLHIGAIIGTGKDIEEGIADLVQKKGLDVAKQDLQKVISDLETLVDDDIINIPGVQDDTLKSVLEELKKAL